MRSRLGRCGDLLRTTALMGTLALAVSGCKTPDITGSTGALGGGLFARRTVDTPDNVTDWRRETADAGERYKANPRDPDAALRYARALRKTGQHPQAAAVLQQATLHNPRDNRLLGDYGRALAENGQLKEAFDALSRAHRPDQPDWRIYSAQGAVLDQMGRHEDARRYYANALSIVPEEPSVLSNLGLSYALSKELGKAEETLRQAEARGSKDRRVKQNLALVIGLQGRFKEAEDIARGDLPPNEAAENIAYLQQMLPQQRPATAVARAKPVVAPKAIAQTKPTSIVEHTGAIKPRPTPAAKPSLGAQAKSRPLVLGAGG